MLIATTQQEPIIKEHTVDLGPIGDVSLMFLACSAAIAIARSVLPGWFHWRMKKEDRESAVTTKQTESMVEMLLEAQQQTITQNSKLVETLSSEMLAGIKSIARMQKLQSVAIDELGQAILVMQRTNQSPELEELAAHIRAASVATRGALGQDPTQQDETYTESSTDDSK